MIFVNLDWFVTFQAPECISKTPIIYQPDHQELSRKKGGKSGVERRDGSDLGGEGVTRATGGRGGRGLAGVRSSARCECE